MEIYSTLIKSSKGRFRKRRYFGGCRLSMRVQISLYAKAFIFIILIVIIGGAIAWHQYPFGVKKYKTVALGMSAAEKAGDSTGWAPPDDRVPEGSEFYVYSLGDENMCIGASCGIGAYFVECLGGWISGYKDIGEVVDYGLRDAGMNIDKEKIITVADKDGKIVGIYPGARIRSLPYIMRKHHDLVSADTFTKCSDLLPQRW